MFESIANDMECCQTVGAFVGVSLEGNIVATRMDANLRFYGDPYLTTSDILLGMVDRPKAAQPLYGSLQELYSCLRSVRFFSFDFASFDRIVHECARRCGEIFCFLIRSRNARRSESIRLLEFVVRARSDSVFR